MGFRRPIDSDIVCEAVEFHRRNLNRPRREPFAPVPALGRNPYRLALTPYGMSVTTAPPGRCSFAGNREIAGIEKALPAGEPVRFLL